MTDSWDNFESPEERANREREDRSRGEFNQRDQEQTRREVEREIERLNKSHRDSKK